MTINEIAKLAGVSRGTVDRVIHNRGKVRPETQELIQTLIRETGFSPNLAASALKRSANGLRLGVILPPLSNCFYEDVLAGIRHAADHYAQYGVTVDLQILPELTPQTQLDVINNLLEDHIDGLALTAINTPELTALVNDLSRQMPIITYNTDFISSDRLCFVGQNHICAGRTAGNLLCASLRKPGIVVPVISYDTLLAHTQRVTGLCSVLDQCPVDVTIAEPLLIHESDQESYDKIAALLQTNQEIACIYVAGGGQVGAADALADSGRGQEIMMICYDLLPATLEHLKNGVVDYTIGQQPFLQGYLPISILYETLALGHRPSTEYYYTSIDIRVRENADFNGISAITGVI